MIFLDQQLHGYRNGHQLLSSSLKLPKTDQELIDRLSDIAGPLRPSEQFKPYLTCYPLPSATHYVVGRTWQDLDAPRAGCVRTRSLLIPMHEWAQGIDIGELLEILSIEGPIGPTKPLQINNFDHLLPRVSISQSIELIEAIFLEDRKPIVVFDASDPELIASRLLAAFWPSFRQFFAISTFALSPRSLSGRSFDLVFAPKDAKSRFSDWPGRRIDATKLAAPRHRWSNEIAERVFSDDRPSLLSEDVLGELAPESGGGEAVLRISLLWNELYGKLHTSPNAVLGLLDIANSRSTRNITAIRKIEPELGIAARLATTTLLPSDAWRYLLALTDKLKDVRLRLSVARSIRAAAIDLADRAPFEAIENVDMLSTVHAQDLLLGAIGDGLALHFSAERAAAITKLPPSNLLQLLLRSPSLAQESLTHYPMLSVRLALALGGAQTEVLIEAKRRLLRLLVEEQQSEAARILIAELDRDELLTEVKLLNSANGLAAESLYAPLVACAQKIGAVNELRDLVAELPNGRGSDALLTHLISPTQSDLQWLLQSSNISEERRLDLLRWLLEIASETQFRAMLVGKQLHSVLDILMKNPAKNIKVVERILQNEKVDPSIAVNTAIDLLPYVDSSKARQLSVRALGILLPQQIGHERLPALTKLLTTIGDTLDGSWAFRIGAQCEVPGQLVSENLIAFNRAPADTRQCFMAAMEDLTSVLIGRRRIDFSEEAAIEMADLMWDSGINDEQALLKSSAVLLPFLLRSREEGASPLIAVAFPVVYQALKDSAQTPDFFRLFFFVDWDRCKILRRDFVEAFMRSSWKPTDVALAAARSGDPERILRLIAQADKEQRVIEEIRRDLSLIPKPWRTKVDAVLRKLGQDEPINGSD